MSTDSAALEFVVDERGQAIMSTVRALGGGAGGTVAENRAFRDRIVHALPRFVFSPALIGACPIRASVAQSFSLQH
jgi:hypothetical protein